MLRQILLWPNSISIQKLFQSFSKHLQIKCAFQIFFLVKLNYIKLNRPTILFGIDRRSPAPKTEKLQFKHRDVPRRPFPKLKLFFCVIAKSALLPFPLHLWLHTNTHTKQASQRVKLALRIRAI